MVCLLRSVALRCSLARCRESCQRVHVSTVRPLRAAQEREGRFGATLFCSSGETGLLDAFAAVDGRRSWAFLYRASNPSALHVIDVFFRDVYPVGWRPLCLTNWGGLSFLQCSRSPTDSAQCSLQFAPVASLAVPLQSPALRSRTGSRRWPSGGWFDLLPEISKLIADSGHCERRFR